MKSLPLRLLLGMAFIACSYSAYAQSAQGRILGRVTDSSGAVVANATVVVTNTGTNVARTLKTNEAGDYSAPNLPAGFYTITASAATFKTIRHTAVQLEVAADLRIDLQLQPGGGAEVVEVTGEAPLVNLIDDTLGSDFNNKLINELPLQGRDFQNLLELTPGMQRTPGGGFHSITTNGLRFEENNFMVDGTDDNDIYYGESVINDVGVSGTPASHLPLDAIQEFNTQENQDSEYGWKPGAVVNIGIKSGTNDFHGTTYYFHRNSALDARNFFNPKGEPVSDLILHEFGASAGGPIIKGKWFIFGNYEGVRHKVGNPFIVDSPVTTSIGDPDVSIPDAEAAAGCPAACNQESLNLVNLFLSNPGTNPDRPTGINFNFNNVNREDNFVIKSDYHFNDKNTLSGHYFYANSLQTEEDTEAIRPDWLSVADTKVGVTGLDWTMVPNSRWVNSLRFGYNRYWQSDNVGDQAKSAADYGLNTGITDPRLGGLPEIDIGSLFTMGGNSSWPLYTEPTTTFQISDTASLSKGHHNIKFGGEFRHGGTDIFRARRGRGRLSFKDSEDDDGNVLATPLENFLLGNFGDDGFAQILTGSEINRNVSMSAFGLFLADDWRIKPRLTLNLGVRYDVTFPLKEAHNQLANFIASKGGLIQVGDGISSPYNTDWNNFSPRLGFAWDVFGSGRTVLRAGGGIIYSQPTIREFVDRAGLNINPSGLAGVTPGTGNISLVQREIDDPTILTDAWQNGTPLFAAAQAAPCSHDLPCDVFGVPQNLATPYVASWNFNIQQQLGKNTSLQAGYVANRGIKLYSHRDINQTNPMASANCYLDDDDSYDGCRQDFRPFTLDCTNGSGRPCMDWVGYATEMENHGSSSYNGLQVTLTQRNFHGLTMVLGYTFAHSLDNATSNRTGFPQDNRTFTPEWASSDTDIRHRLTISMVYDAPTFKAPWRIGEGWQFTSIVNLQGGEPFSLFDDFDDISFSGEFADRWNFSGNPKDVHWTSDPSKAIPYFFGDDALNNPKCNVSPNPDLDFFGCFISGSAVITPPAYGTFGNMGRNIFRGPGLANWDMSVSKMWKLSERVNLQLRGEFFNILNHPNFDGLYVFGTDLTDPVDGEGPNDLGVSGSTPDVGASNPVIGLGGSRHIQLGAKFIW